MPATAIQNHHRGGSRKLPPPFVYVVRMDFTADRPGIKFVANIIYIHMWQGFIYLATVIDCNSKKVVGWAIEDHMPSELVGRILLNAADTTRIEQDAIFHSDLGRSKPAALITPACESLYAFRSASVSGAEPVGSVNPTGLFPAYESGLPAPGDH